MEFLYKIIWYVSGMALEVNDVTQIPEPIVIPRFLPVKHLRSIPQLKLVVFDLETTGLSK